ncbi:hypothetical protein TRAPUB_9834 [Trametes pubescens]|uniref:Uncharacterized protein n=1 Tax=Trametes pubescens TaxID=154538 RepID=A0A1M2W199_TRAPU|nr:hypothetical protein TRAPUB_9834 [Trametes pubescens]
MATLDLVLASDESEDNLSLERYFLAGDLIIGVGYGLQLVLWFLCTSYLWRKRNRGWMSTLLLIYLAVLLVTETVFVVAEGLNIQHIYVDNRNFPGGPWRYHLSSQTSATNVTFNASIFVLTFLGDLLVLWRCWVVWSAFDTGIAVTAVSLPVLILSGSFVLGAIWTLQSSHPELAIYRSVPLAFGTAYYAVSLALNVILTALITGRLLAYRRAHIALLPADHARQYLCLVAVVVESAAIHTAAAIAFVTSYGLSAPANVLLMGLASAAQQVASYLIIYRVADGKAWSRDMPRLETITSLKFASREDPLPHASSPDASLGTTDTEHQGEDGADA